jgi:hypothetical protein
MGTKAGNDPELTTATSLVVAEVIHDAGILDEYTTNNINPIIALKKIQLIIESKAVKKALIQGARLSDFFERFCC